MQEINLFFQKSKRYENKIGFALKEKERKKKHPKAFSDSLVLQELNLSL